MPTIDVKALDASPNDCPIGDPLNLDITFTSDEAVAGAYWEIKYMVDMTGKRHIVEVGKTDPADIPVGESKMSFSCTSINLGGVKKSWLNNVGLLLACLMSPSGEEIIQVSMVTQAMKKGDAVHRMIMSPLD